MLLYYIVTKKGIFAASRIKKFSKNLQNVIFQHFKFYISKP